MMKERMTAVIYTRGSTRDQAERDGEADGYSLAAQVESCRRKAESLGLVVIDEYCDRGESAKSADRPALQEMLERVEAKQDVGYVIVHKVDRLARNRVDDVALNAVLQTAGVTPVSCSESIAETPTRQLPPGLMASSAEVHHRTPRRRLTQPLHAPNPPAPSPANFHKLWPWMSEDPRDSQLRKFPPPWDAGYASSSKPSRRSAAEYTAIRCLPRTA